MQSAFLQWATVAVKRQSSTHNLNIQRPVRSAVRGMVNESLAMSYTLWVPQNLRNLQCDIKQNTIYTYMYILLSPPF